MNEPCAHCGSQKRTIQARHLCSRCYDHHRRTNTLDQYPILSRGEVPEIAGISYRQLDWWVRKGYLYPTRPAEGSGYRREWPESEVAVAKEMVRLVAAQIPPALAVEIARGRTEIAPGIRIVVEPPPSLTPVGADEEEEG